MVVTFINKIWLLVCSAVETARVDALRLKGRSKLTPILLPFRFIKVLVTLVLGGAIIRIGASPEKTVFAAWSIFRSVGAFLLGCLSLGKVNGTSVTLINIDRINELPKKYLLTIDGVRSRVDITGLGLAGVPLSSDTRIYNRGNLVIGEEWTDSHNHRIIGAKETARPQDYRFVTHETIRLMFVEGESWETTPEYFLFKSQIEDGQKPYGLSDLNDLDDRGRRLVALYESMSQNGYMSSESIGGEYWDEAHFYLDQSGNIALGRHGNHRLAIARLLGLSHFPALFGGVHLQHVKSLGANVFEIRKAVMKSVLGNPAVSQVLPSPSGYCVNKTA